MRLDKLMSETGLLTRRECALAVRRGEITVDSLTVKDPSMHVDPLKATVCLRGTPVVYRRFTYVMLNKPTGYVSATEDTKLPYVVELLSPELQKIGLFPIGRLDRDTVGLMILSNNGPLAHALLSPKKHVEKIYRFSCLSPLIPEAEERVRAGLHIDGYDCKSARLTPDPDRMSGTITLTEGKYHQIKRMFEFLDNKITFLERISFAGIPLDPSLARGEYRLLTEEETAKLESDRSPDRSEK